MKNLLQNLLIVFSMLLCALIAYQWVRETMLRKQNQSITETLHTRMEAIEDLEATTRHNDDEISRLDAIKNKLAQTVTSNELQLLSLAKELEKAQAGHDRAKVQIDVYREALDRANQNILAQNKSIRKQNEELARIVEERNSIVLKFNKAAEDFNDLAQKWNQQQEKLAAAATNRSSVTPKEAR